MIVLVSWDCTESILSYLGNTVLFEPCYVKCSFVLPVGHFLANQLNASMIQVWLEEIIVVSKVFFMRKLLKNKLEAPGSAYSQKNQDKNSIAFKWSINFVIYRKWRKNGQWLYFCRPLPAIIHTVKYSDLIFCLIWATGMLYNDCTILSYR